MRRENVVLIGAGSVVFTAGLIADFIADGGAWELRLVDVDAEKLETAHRLATRMIAAKGAPIALRRATQHRDALPGADAVVTTLDVGGRPAWEQDIRIPREHGMYWAVSDTTTPGGLSRSLRIIPPLVSIARDMAALCPSAILFNYCNPMAAIVRAVARETETAVLGLCHGIPNAKRYLAGFLDLDERRCDCVGVGFNHFVWLLEFRVDGRDGYPLIRARNEDLKKRGQMPGNDPDNPLAWELFETFGLFPASRDRHITEFFPHFFPAGRHYGKTLGIDRFSFEQCLRGNARRYAQMQRMAAGETDLPAALFHEVEGQHEQLVCLLRALRQPQPQTYHATMPNTGSIAGLRQELCLECPIAFSERAIEPVPIPVLPAGIKACIEKAFLTADLIVEAALERDRSKFVQALVVDGCCASVARAGTLADALIAAQKTHLPGW
ncbi:MAG: hypothetical protein JXR37_03670 [Kiritimatiellae bacterium]|nr:hypothetical protein [Kiritimatiellia bacterium]